MKMRIKWSLITNLIDSGLNSLVSKAIAYEQSRIKHRSRILQEAAMSRCRVTSPFSFLKNNKNNKIAEAWVELITQINVFFLQRTNLNHRDSENVIFMAILNKFSSSLISSGTTDCWSCNPDKCEKKFVLLSWKMMSLVPNSFASCNKPLTNPRSFNYF